MIYGNVDSFLNGEVRKPIKQAIEKGGTTEEVLANTMEVVDYLCGKFKEMNAVALWYEKQYGTPKNIKEFVEFMNEHCK